MPEIPLDPQNGGMSITLRALEPGDLVMSTTSAWGSDAIRAVTGGGPASHVRIYAGSGHAVVPSFIEAVPDHGVSTGIAELVLAEDSVAVAFRHRLRRDSAASAAVNYAIAQLGKSYDTWGAVTDALFRHLNGKRHVNLMTPANTFYCSKLVIEAYGIAAMPLVTDGPQWETPNDLVPLTWTDELVYLGHLKFTP